MCAHVPLTRSERSRLLARLELEPDAHGDAIRHAYRRLALQLHPDHGGDPADTADFLAVEEAYRWLSADDRAIAAEGLRQQPRGTPRSPAQSAAARPPHPGGSRTAAVDFSAGPVHWSPSVNERPER